jgi:hypothetical protein
MKLTLSLALLLGVIGACTQVNKKSSSPTQASSEKKYVIKLAVSQASDGGSLALAGGPGTVKEAELSCDDPKNPGLKIKSNTQGTTLTVYGESWTGCSVTLTKFELNGTDYAPGTTPNTFVGGGVELNVDAVKPLTFPITIEMLTFSYSQFQGAASAIGKNRLPKKSTEITVSGEMAPAFSITEFDVIALDTQTPAIQLKMACETGKWDAASSRCDGLATTDLTYKFGVRPTTLGETEIRDFIGTGDSKDLVSQGDGTFIIIYNLSELSGVNFEQIATTNFLFAVTHGTKKSIRYTEITAAP